MRYTEVEAEALYQEQVKKLDRPSYLEVEGTEFIATSPHTPDEGPESKLQAKIMAWAKQKGYPIFHDRSRRKNERGWPDVFLYLPDGRHILIELKSAKGQLRPEQVKLRQQLEFLGHEYYKVRSYKQFLQITAKEL